MSRSARLDVSPPTPKSETKNVNSAERTNWWAWVHGIGLLLGMYLVIAFQKLSDCRP